VGVRGVFTAPTGPLTAIAYVGEYPVDSGSTRFTFPFAVDAAQIGVFQIPRGARGFRLAGNPSAAGNPFKAGDSWEVNMPGGFIDQYTGPQMLALRNTGGFIPLAGGARSLTYQEGGAVNTTGSIVWELDL